MAEEAATVAPRTCGDVHVINGPIVLGHPAPTAVCDCGRVQLALDVFKTIAEVRR